MAEKAPWLTDSTLITPQILDAVRHVESRGNVNAVSPVGARGPYQFMPGTAKQYGLANPHDEPSARKAAARYLTDLANTFGGDVDKALLAYNWGPGNVQKGGKMPLEAQQYVRKVRMAEQGGGRSPRKVNDGDEAPPWKTDSTEEEAPWKTDSTAKKSALPKATKPKIDDDILMQGLKGAKHSWDKAAAALQSAAGSIGLPTGESLEPMVAAGKKYVEDTGPASSIGEFAGDVAIGAAPGARAGSLVSGGVRMLPQALTKTKAVLNAVLPGAAAGAAGSAVVGDDPLVGAGGGAVAGPLMKGAGALGSKVLDVANEMTGGVPNRIAKHMATTFGDRKQQVIDALRNLRGDVPGESLTAGRAADVSTPELKVFEERARKGIHGRKFLGRDEANQAAQAKVLDNIADPGRQFYNIADQTLEPSMHQAARSQVVDPLLARSRNQRVGMPPEVEALMNAPRTQRLLNVNQGANETARLNTAAAPPAPGAQNPLVPDEGLFMPQQPTRSIDELWTVRRDIDDQLKQLAGSPHPDAALRAKELMRERGRITDAMKQSGDFSLANTMFKNMSAPQNQADVASVLRRSLDAASPGTRASQFEKAMEDAPRTIKRADLSPRFENIGDVMTPDQMRQVGGVGSALRREADYAKLSTAPGMVPENISPLETLERKVPGLISPAVTAIRTALRVAGRKSDEQVQAMIDEAMLDPRRMADLIETIPVGMRNSAINKLRGVLTNQTLQNSLIGAAAAQ
jgi:hypothetical protein